MKTSMLGGLGSLPSKESMGDGVENKIVLKHSVVPVEELVNAYYSRKKGKEGEKYLIDKFLVNFPVKKELTESAVQFLTKVFEINSFDEEFMSYYVATAYKAVEYLQQSTLSLGIQQKIIESLNVITLKTNVNNVLNNLKPDMYEYLPNIDLTFNLIELVAQNYINGFVAIEVQLEKINKEIGV